MIAVCISNEYRYSVFLLQDLAISKNAHHLEKNSLDAHGIRPILKHIYSFPPSYSQFSNFSCTPFEEFSSIFPFMMWIFILVREIWLNSHGEIQSAPLIALFAAGRVNRGLVTFPLYIAVRVYIYEGNTKYENGNGINRTEKAIKRNSPC